MTCTVEKMADWYFHNGSPIQAACCHLVVNDHKVHTVSSQKWKQHTKCKAEVSNKNRNFFIQKGTNFTLNGQYFWGNLTALPLTL